MKETNSICLVSYHGGYLAYDMYLKKIVMTDFFSKNRLRVFVSDNKLAVYDGILKSYLRYSELQVVLVYDSHLSNIDLEYYTQYISISYNGLFLRCDMNLQLSFSAKTVREWEFFYFSNFRKIDVGFDDDRYLSINHHQSYYKYKPIPKIIWMYWETGDKPIIIEKCIERVKLLNPDSQVNVLSKENISDYLPMEYVQKLYHNPNITPTHRSDVIRLKLLYDYGGIWLDASVLVNVSFDEIIISDGQFDCIGFYLKQHFQHFKQNKIPVIENWFMASPKNSDFIKGWLDYLTPILDVGADGLLEQFSQRQDFNIVKNNFFKLDYFIAYLSQQAVLLDYPESFNLLAWCADNSALYYHTKYGWGDP